MNGTARQSPASGMIRLQKVIAASGLASRRAAETMIRNGEVTVNGKVVRVMGTCVDPVTDHVKVNGRHVPRAEPEVFVLLHKPHGYVTTMRDPQGRPTIADLLDGVKVRVAPVGRLDYDAEGLLLLTNNGQVAQACMHPRYHVPKTYVVKVSGLCTDEEIRTLQNGVALDDGVTAPAVVKKFGKAKVNSWLELTIHEGKKRQVKRMIEALGHRVARIKRTMFGPLALGTLRVGTCRFATDAEANALRALLRQPIRARTMRPAGTTKAGVSARPTRPARFTGPARPTRPAMPTRPARFTGPARPARPTRATSPARPRTSAFPARRDADGGRRRPQAQVGKTGGTGKVRGRRPHTRARVQPQAPVGKTRGTGQAGGRRPPVGKTRGTGQARGRRPPVGKARGTGQAGGRRSPVSKARGAGQTGGRRPPVGKARGTGRAVGRRPRERNNTR